MNVHTRFFFADDYESNIFVHEATMFLSMVCSVDSKDWPRFNLAIRHHAEFYFQCYW